MATQTAESASTLGADSEKSKLQPNRALGHSLSINVLADAAVVSQEASLAKYLNEMAEKCTSPKEKKDFLIEMEGFKQLFARYRAAKGKTIEWEKIKPAPPDMLVHHADLENCPKDKEKTLLNKLCVLKLNGGLGTSMGCVGPKSVIEVRSELSFLDLNVLQTNDLNMQHNAKVPLILMNSFNTHDDTLKVITKYTNVKEPIRTFNQSRFPRIIKDSLLPMAKDPQGDLEDWYPPGHGDVYRALYNSGLLDEMLREGKEFVFLSNIDNLGATVDLKILHYMESNKIDFLAEVTDKTRSDIKGGTLIEYEGKARLFEIAQCPPSKVDEFKSIKKFKIFNTNNLWISLKAIKELVQADKLKDVEVIVNPKKARGKEVIQLETAAGAAIQFFNNAKGVNVPRSRFLPVKSTSDLFVVQSNLYQLLNGYLMLDPKRPYPSVPTVTLGDKFKNVGDYNIRLRGIPNILELDQLTVSGDVTFGSGVTLKGTVIIVANQGCRIDIPDGAVIENKVISGNLRILEH